MESKNIAIGIVVVGAVLLGSYFIFQVALPQGSFSTLFSEEDKNELKNYSSEELKISFQYPANYVLEEKTINEAERLHKTLVLTEKSSTIPENGEGPTAITIDVFQNNLDREVADQFIKNSSNSNYKLGSGDLEEGTLSGLQAFRYYWDGLYRGESIVAANENYVYMLSVTSLGETDTIRRDFYDLINTVVIGQ